MTTSRLTDYSRQENIITPRQLAGRPFHIIGCGGIGSIAALAAALEVAMGPALVKLGLREFVLWDFDIVEEPNLPNQAYTPEQAGLPKVEALAGILKAHGARRVTVKQCRYEGQEPLEGFVLSAVDSITARSVDIWPHVRHNIEVELFLDGRIGGPQLRLLTVQPNLSWQVEGYENTLFSQKQAAELACGERAFIGPAMGLAMHITGQLIAYVNGEDFPNNIMYNLFTRQYLEGFWPKPTD